MFKVLHGRILQKPFFVFWIIVFKLLIFICLFGFDVIQRFLLSVARDSKPPQQPGLVHAVPLLNVVQIRAHAQYAIHVVIRLVRVNHGQIQAQHGVCAGNANPPFSRLNHVVTVARHRLVNERNWHFVHGNFVVLGHNFADARVLGDNYARKVVVFQALLHLARADFRIHGQHVKVRDLRKHRLLRFRQVSRVLRNGVPPEKHQLFIYERVAHRAE